MPLMYEMPSTHRRRRTDAGPAPRRAAGSLGAGALLVAAVALASLAPGCKSGLGDDPILRLSAAEALAEGKTLMADEKYARARRYLSHAFEVEPNSLSGREALLLLADSYFLDGGAVNYVQAEAKYRDFLNRFPTSDQSAYAQYQIANSLAGRMEKPDRDQSATEAALAAFEELIRLYPTSEYVAEARERIGEVRERLAEHEYVIGHFYLRRGLAVAAIDRYEDLLDAFPDYDERAKVLCDLALAYSKSRDPRHSGKVAEVVERLREEHPDSECARALPPAILDGGAGEPEEPAR